MFRKARFLLKMMGLFLCALILPVVLFLGAAMIGAHVPRSPVSAHAKEMASNSQTVTIYLVTGLLHADIAIPYDAALRDKFPWLVQTRLPLDNPRLAYLAFGWGSKAFYTTAGTYRDIGVSNTFTAVTGDMAVMRVIGLGALEAGPDVYPVRLDKTQYLRLLEAISSGFAVNENRAEYLPQYSIGQGDAFFAGNGHFNILNPCNQWTADVLSYAGLKVGRWTPTTHALIRSLKWHGEIR